MVPVGGNKAWRPEKKRTRFNAILGPAPPARMWPARQKPGAVAWGRGLGARTWNGRESVQLDFSDAALLLVDARVDDAAARLGVHQHRLVGDLQQQGAAGDVFQTHGPGGRNH